MTPTEAMYNQLPPKNRQRVNQRIDALLLQQERDKLTQEEETRFEIMQPYIERIENRRARQDG